MTLNTSLVDYYSSQYQPLSTNQSLLTTMLDLSSIKVLAQPLSSLICANGNSGSAGAGQYQYQYTNTSSSGWTKPYESGADKLSKRLDAIEARLCILQPNFDKHEKFAALKRAYENYKIVEALCTEQQQEP